MSNFHNNYESIPAFPGVKVSNSPGDLESPGEYLVSKMRFPQKDQKDTIIYICKITIENIPAKACEYIVNGKRAIEWIMERYHITTLMQKIE